MKTLKHLSVIIFLTITSAISLADELNASGNAANSRLIIYRPSLQNTQSALYYRVFVDQKYLGKLKNGHHYVVHVAPGEHHISANNRERTNLAVVVASQTTSVVRAEISRRNKLIFAAVSPQQAVQEAPELAQYFPDRDSDRFALRAF